MKRALQTAVGVFSWVFMVGLWVVLIRTGNVTLGGVGKAALELGVLSALVLGGTLWWVRHNVAIYRKKGPRTGRPTNVPRTDVDRPDHPLRWRIPGGVHGARAVRHLVVRIEGGEKTYRRAE